MSDMRRPRNVLVLVALLGASFTIFEGIRNPGYLESSTFSKDQLDLISQQPQYAVHKDIDNVVPTAVTIVQEVTDNVVPTEQTIVQEVTDSIVPTEQEIVQDDTDSVTPVLLVTYMRSGSSWLGDILKQAKQFLYIYEPFQYIIQQGYYKTDLVCFYNRTCRQPLKPIEMHHLTIESLLKMYQCDMESLQKNVKRNVLRQRPAVCIVKPDVGNLNLKDNVHLKSQNNTGDSVSNNETHTKAETPTCINNIKELTDVCRKAKYIIVKTIRMSMELMVPLLESITTLKLIYLARDPRAITNSRNHCSGMYMAHNVKSHSVALCKQMEMDISVVENLRNKYPERVTTVLYEALAERPNGGAKYVYNFLGLKYDNKVENWVYQSTHAQRNNGFFLTQRTSAVEASSHWRNELPFLKVKTIQLHCSTVLSSLGYISFSSLGELKNVSIPSRRQPHLPGFA